MQPRPQVQGQASEAISSQPYGFPDTPWKNIYLRGCVIHAKDRLKLQERVPRNLLERHLVFMVLLLWARNLRNGLHIGFQQFFTYIYINCGTDQSVNSDVCKPNIYPPRGPGSRLSEPDHQRHMGFLTQHVEQILTKGLCGILHGNSSSCRHEFHTISLRGIYTHTAAISLARNMRSGSEIELQHFIKDWPTFTLIAELTRLWCEIRRLQTKKLLTERPGFKAK